MQVKIWKESDFCIRAEDQDKNVYRWRLSAINGIENGCNITPAKARFRGGLSLEESAWNRVPEVQAAVKTYLGVSTSTKPICDHA